MLNSGWEARSYVILFDDLLKSTTFESQPEIEKREAYFYHLKGQFEEKLDIAIENYRKSFKITENHGSLYYLEAPFLAAIGRALRTKGEYDLAVNSFKEALKFLKGNKDN